VGGPSAYEAACEVVVRLAEALLVTNYRNWGRIPILRSDQKGAPGASAPERSTPD